MTDAKKTLSAWQIAYNNLTADKLIKLIAYLIAENDIPAESLVTFRDGYIVFQKDDGENIVLQMVNN